MRCTSCDYPLWNLTARQCPECGTPFRPSEFEFVPNSVRFCCPHCDQEYYGISETGLLDPVEFNCVTCNRHLHMDETVLRPAEHVEEKKTRPGIMPWFERKHRGTVKAFFQTIGMAMGRPHTLIRGVPVDSSVGSALVYGIQTTIVLCVIGGLIPGIIWLLAYYGIGGMRGAGGMGGFFWYGILFYMMPYWILLPFAVLGMLVFWPMITHLALRWTGGCAHPIDRTIQAFAYSAGANALTAIPCIGISFGWIWWFISATIMVKAGQKVHGGRAMVSVLVLPVFLLIVCGGVIGIGIWGQRQLTASMMGGTGFSPQTSTTWSINQGLITSSWQNNSQGPTHVIETALSGQMSVMTQTWAAGGVVTSATASPAGKSSFCHPDSQTTDADIPVGDGTLQDFLAASASEKMKTAAQVLDATPGSIVAYRFGDFIFTYPGAFLNTMDNQLWTMVMLPDPDVNGIPGAKDTVHLATADHGVQEVTFDQLPGLLQQQNQYRATLQMPPLPDLITITHDKPAVSVSTSGGDESEESN